MDYLMTSKPENLSLDWEHLHEISGGDTEFERDLLQLFLEDTQTHVEAVKQAIANQDVVLAERSAHHIKGASANVGMAELAQIAAELEQQAKEQLLEIGPSHLEAMAQTLQQLQSFLDGSQ